jgi:hypothetical protein
MIINDAESGFGAPEKFLAPPARTDWLKLFALYQKDCLSIAD